VGRATSIIEINGASYNVTTGKAVSGKGKLAPIAVIDGFIKRSPNKSTLRTKVQTKSKHSKTKRSSESRSAKSPAATMVHQRAERSSTLVRNAVQRPSLKFRSAVSNIAKPVSNRLTSEKARISRAANTPKHSAVNRFARPKAVQSSISVEAKPLRLRPRARQPEQAQPAHSMATTSHQQLERMLDEALTNADAHKQLLKQHRYGRAPFKKFMLLPRWLRSLILVLAIILIGLIALWHYVPQVSVSLAAHKAQINASTSAYTPSGYGFSKASTIPNGISIKYKSSDSTSNYTVNEEKSAADSTSTASKTIDKGTSVQTSEVAGNTVYIYGPSDNALWVNNGIKYTINNNAGLSSEQLLQIVQGF